MLRVSSIHLQEVTVVHEQYVDVGVTLEVRLHRFKKKLK